MNLPADLRAAVDELVKHRSQKDLAERARKISERYRDHERSPSRFPLHLSSNDVLAYVATRMPATFAACAHVFSDVATIAPDFGPETLLDLGCGPGTALWAAGAQWPSLREALLIDSNSNFLTVGQQLEKADGGEIAGRWIHGTIGSAIGDEPPADLVVAAYLLSELQESDLEKLLEKIWHRTRSTLVLIEPGSPRGHARLMDARAQLVDAGAHTIAPCPHDRACPLEQDDWCHFSVRLPRSKLHRTVKASDLSFEDEKFSYVVLSRVSVARDYRRVIKHTKVTKGHVELDVCQASGIAIERILRRDRGRYHAARKIRWGDIIETKSEP